MHKDIKLILIISLNFIYSVSLLGIIFFYSLLGIMAKDNVTLVITEATGFQRTMPLLTATVLPLELHNLFWLSLAATLFCLIFLYLLLHSFHAFWGAAVLSVLVFLLMLSVRSIIMIFVPSEPYYMLSVLDRWHQANVGVLLFGLLLFCLAYLGDRYILKKSAQTETTLKASGH